MDNSFARLPHRPLIGCSIQFGSIFSTQLIARVGFDWVLIDMEHNPLSSQLATTLAHTIIAASAGQCRPLIRVPSRAVEWTKWALDSGAAGIVVPMVQSRADAEEVVRNAAYPPLGERSFGPLQAPFAELDPKATAATYLTQRSPNIQIIPMIESKRGLQNAEEICSTEGVTAVFIGPVDLRMSMGLKGGDGDEEEYTNALKTIVAICKRLNRPVGTFATGEAECAKRAQDGFDFILCPGEATMLVRGAKASLAECIKGLEKTARL